MFLSEILKEAGIDPKESELIKTNGDISLNEKYLSKFQREEIIESEVSIQASKKKMAELDLRNKDSEAERSKKQEIHKLLKAEVQKTFPKKMYQEVYHHLYDSLTGIIALEMMDKAQFEVEGTNIVINGQKNDGVKPPANELERVMQKSKISFHKAVTLEDLVQKSFEDNGGYSFLTR